MIKLSRLAALLVAGAIVSAPTFAADKGPLATLPPGEYRLVGTSSPRVDIAGKAAGAWTYVHDVRVPGMLHGHVVRPPYAGRDSGDFIGRSLLEVDEDEALHMEHEEEL